MGARRKGERGDVVVVAVDGSKEITDYALEWAVRNVIKPADTLILIAIIPRAASPNGSRHSVYQFLAGLMKKWGLLQEKESVDQATCEDGDCEELQKINAVCVHMMKQFCSANQLAQIETHVEIVADAQTGAVAAKAHEFGASWIILDRRLKKEGDACLKQLISNVVLIDQAISKVLRLLNSRSQGGQHALNPDSRTDISGIYPVYRRESNNATPTSSLGLDSHSLNTDVSWSLSSADREVDNPAMAFGENSPSSKSLLQLKSNLFGQEEKKGSLPMPRPRTRSQRLNSVFSYDEKEGLTIDRCRRQSGLLQGKLPPKAVATQARRSVDALQNAGSSRSFRYSKDREQQSNAIVTSNPSRWNAETIDRMSSIRKTMSLSNKQPPTPPPLCSACKHKAPIFGKPPRKFNYREMKIATDGFSPANFLAEGGYGPVYKGILPDGQVVAVKQHRTVSTQGASEFCSEVEVLSCAQHRNLVMLVGYCVEKEWLLVYEFACNGSLDKHLYGNKSQEVMSWQSRLKVATGAARGLRYLHEDCRVGCIVHRDLRPNNILLTHDFEAMVGDFGLARWQVDGQSAEETRVIGTFGYLAPEYTRTGQITEKADVYAFGVLLMELLSGRRAIDLSRSQGQQYLPEWGRPLLSRKMINKIMDPRLEGNYVRNEALSMMHAASFCISQDPKDRPRISKVLRMLEGDMPTEARRPPPAPVRSRDTSGRLSSTEPGTASKIEESLASEDYQAYLQGSLADFIHRMKNKSDEFGKTSLVFH
ncbi:inactive protein kinase SELMODRAFT_444075-like [Aristolochia californica]|uniref:inactive protein kinase SELMODRAFT_444075-like n=1 Tax=Aristolochia californica TaxID=171875 RepID=UPI0035D63E5A